MLTDIEKKYLESLRAKLAAKTELSDDEKVNLALLEAKEKAPEPKPKAEDDGKIERLSQQVASIADNMKNFTAVLHDLQQTGRKPEGTGEEKLAADVLRFQDEERARAKKLAGKPIFPGREEATPSNGPADVKAIYDNMIEMPARSDEQSAVQKMSDMLLIAARIKMADSQRHGNAPMSFDQAVEWVRNSSGFKKRFAFEAGNSRIALALYGSTNYGGDLVPTMLSPDIVERVHVATRVEGLFEPFAMRSMTENMPYESADTEIVSIAEETSDASPTQIAAATPTTSKVTLTAKKFGYRIAFSEELSEDSIAPLEAWLNRHIARTVPRGLEYAYINGDTTNPHMDSDISYGSTHRAAQWIGLRKMTQSAAKASLATFNWDTVSGVRKLMGTLGANEGECAWIVGVKTYLGALLNLKDAQNNAMVTTVDKAATAATFLTGFLYQMGGLPIVVSEGVRENLNASGVYDGTTTTKGVLLCVHRPSFVVGTRRDLTIIPYYEPKYDQMSMTVTIRKAFSCARSYTAEYPVALGYNIPV